MGPLARSRASRYGVAVLGVVVVLLVRWFLYPLLGDSLPFLPFLFLVVAVAWHGGFGPSFLALILGLFATAYFFLPPRYSVMEGLLDHQAQAFGFLFLGLTIGLFSGALRSARGRAEANACEAVRQRQELELEMGRRRLLEEELHKRAEQLAEADRRKDEFLALLGHELRNPLAPIRNAVQVMKLLRLTDARLQWARDVIDRQMGQMVRLVDDLLDVSRISHGQITLKTEPIELAEVIQRAIEISRPLLESRGHQWTISLPSEPIWLQADMVRLAQVVANLLNNAGKYTPDQGQIRLTAEQQGQEIMLRVSDNGVGIAPDMLPRVFDLFVQAANVLDRSEGGLGIGLTLVKRLVELHGGRIEAHSAGVGQGSEFIVHLPVVPTTVGTTNNGDSHMATPAPAPAAVRRILAVDDNVDAAATLALWLRTQGHEVRIAHDGLAALHEAEAFRPEVILLDIGLPQMDGYEVARRLREQLGMKSTLLIALTGYGKEEDRRRSRAAGFDVHLVKPADLAQLRSLLAGSKSQPHRAHNAVE